jgi:HEAT repeat protein
MSLRSGPALACAALLIPLSVYGQQTYTPKQRIAAIRDLGKKSPQAIPTIAQYLTDPDRDVRLAAVKAIVRLDTTESLTPLVQATHDADSEIQIRATDGLVNDYYPGYVKTGMTTLLTRGVRQAKAFFDSRNDQAVRKGTVIRPDVADALSSLIEHGAGAEVRANAARAAGILRASATVPALESALQSKDSTIIFESLVALQKIGDATAGPAAASKAFDLDPRIQITALETVGVLHSKDSAPQLRAALRDARNIRVRRAALEALAMLALPEDRPLFQQYARDTDADLRASALEGLGRIREPEDEEVLEAAYNEANADPKVHLAAAFALVDEGNVSGVEFAPLPYLIENLAQPGRGGTATAYLTELCRRAEVRRAVFPLVAQATNVQKIALCSIFGTVGAADSVPVLTELSRDIDPDVSLAATKALHQIQTRSA